MPLKICPNCHRGCNEDNEYCPTCKTKFPDVPKNIPTVENPTSGSGADKSPSINPVIVVIAIVGLIIVAYFSMGLFFPKTGESASNLQGSGSSSTSLITPTPTYNSATAGSVSPNKFHHTLRCQQPTRIFNNTRS